MEKSFNLCIHISTLTSLQSQARVRKQPFKRSVGIKVWKRMSDSDPTILKSQTGDMSDTEAVFTGKKGQTLNSGE